MAFVLLVLDLWSDLIRLVDSVQVFVGDCDLDLNQTPKEWDVRLGPRGILNILLEVETVAAITVS